MTGRADFHVTEVVEGPHGACRHGDGEDRKWREKEGSGIRTDVSEENMSNIHGF